MKKTVLILFILISFALLSAQNDEQYQYNHGRPTSRGIDYYVKTNTENFIKEYQAFIEDTLYNYNIGTVDFRTYKDYVDYNPLELGFFSIPDEIEINNQEKYCDYDIKFVNKHKKRNLDENDVFVKGTVMHELTHDYFYQIKKEMQMHDIHYDIAYSNIIYYPNTEIEFGAKFIEEGICTYVQEKMQESVPLTPYKPNNVNDITNKDNLYFVVYKYSYFYLQDYLDKATKHFGGIKEGIINLLANKPPTYKELLNPNIFFNRLH
jgi:hypothetical protein